MKSLEVEGARATVPQSWRRHCIVTRTDAAELPQSDKNRSFLPERLALILASGPVRHFHEAFPPQTAEPVIAVGL